MRSADASIAGDKAQEVETGRVGPVEVVEQQHERSLCRERSEKILHLIEECRLTGDVPDRATLGKGIG